VREIHKIIIHCSDSPFGEASIINEWHKQRGWRGIGYHVVICNCYVDSIAWKLQRPNPYTDGFVEYGRQFDKIGAHCKGHNSDSIGICLIGKDSFTQSQFRALQREVKKLWELFPGAKVYGHREFDTGKTCPNIDPQWLRDFLNHGTL